MSLNSNDPLDTVFVAHYVGCESPAEALKLLSSQKDLPRNCRDVKKVACSNAKHANCGDCLKHIWEHNSITISGKTGCLLGDMMHDTIMLRRSPKRPDLRKEHFESFKKALEANIDYVVRVVSARHLVSFLANYVTEGNPLESASAAMVHGLNLCEKLNNSCPPTQGIVHKTTDGKGIADVTFCDDGSYHKSVTNFTMYNWRGRDGQRPAIYGMVDLMLAGLKNTPVIRRLTMSVVAWSMLYKNTVLGRASIHAAERKWRKAVIDGYTK